MFRLLVCSLLNCLFISISWGAEKPRSEEAISKAIVLLESERGKTEDLLEQAKIDKAIRDLESLITEAEVDSKPTNASKLSVMDFAVKPAALKKKFGGKATFNPKAGELTLMYDFVAKGQLVDFESNGANVVTARKTLMIDGGDSVVHVAKFRNFNVSAIMSIKSMRASGISSTNGTRFYMGGQNPDTIYLSIPGGENTSTIVPADVRSGNIPISFDVNATKASIRYGGERLVVQFARKEGGPQKEDIHQIVFNSGPEGCGISKLIIVGVPDPDWFKEFLDVE